jgi:hypothetical protein
MVLVTPHGRERSVLPSPRFVNVLYPAFRPIRVVVGLVSRMVAAVFERLRSDIV